MVSSHFIANLQSGCSMLSSSRASEEEQLQSEEASLASASPTSGQTKSGKQSEYLSSTLQSLASRFHVLIRLTILGDIE